jgi:hypothetical protein
MGVVSSWVSHVRCWVGTIHFESSGAMNTNLQILSLPAGPGKAFLLLNYGKLSITVWLLIYYNHFTFLPQTVFPFAQDGFSFRTG